MEPAETGVTVRLHGMDDHCDPPYASFGKPQPKTLPRPVEHLWTVQNNHVFWSCRLRYHGESGVEAQTFRNGEIVIGRRFETRALAIGWAKAERQTKSGAV
jgi:hypothetical protein